MALRATYGNMAGAVEWIIRKREEKSQIREQEREDLARRKLQKKLGKCEDGQPVNVQLFRQLKSMGYSPILIAASLKRTNNEVNGAIQLMTDEAFINSAISKAIKSLTNETQRRQAGGASTSAAVDPDAAAAATAAAVAAALANLQNPSEGGSSSSASDTDAASLLQSAKALLDKTFSEENLLAGSTQSEEDFKMSQKAYDTLKKGTCSEAEYIDLSLSAEQEYLSLYKTRIDSMIK
jgi:hypothetical protein